MSDKTNTDIDSAQRLALAPPETAQKSMKQEPNSEAAETVQTKETPAVAQERLVRPFVECPRCQGKGNVLMGSELWETLQVVSKMKGEFCAEDVAAKIVGVHPTTMNNRMATLLEMELIEFTSKDGKRKMFRFRWPNAAGDSPPIGG